MNKRNTIIGVVLIFLGISMYMSTFHVRNGSSLTLLLGLSLLYAYYVKREQPFLIFGGIFTAIGLMSVLGDINFFHINMTFEAVLIALGAIFIFMYYTKHIHGFIFPGVLLPAVGIYFILLRSYNDMIAGPSILLLLGFAFYVIYFIEYIGKSAWPLIPATILLFLGILTYAFNFKIITWNMLLIKVNYIWPLLMVVVGLSILVSRIKSRG